MSSSKKQVPTNEEERACPICFEILNIVKTHDPIKGCPVRGSFWCSQCSCYGHRPEECDEKSSVRRPRCLEELIPEDLKARWGIRSFTPIVFTRAETLEEKENEIAPTNSILVPHKDAEIRQFMRSQKLQTVHKMSENVRILREWAVGQGKKIVLTPIK